MAALSIKIWLIRHGLTRLGEEKRYQGSVDEGLSTKGRSMLSRAEDLYPEFGEVHGLETFPGHLYVSPALRARQTASILFPGADQILVPDLREMDFGAFEGRGWWEMEKDPRYRAWVDGGCLGRCPGGEDRVSFSGRVCGAFREILRKETLDKSDLKRKNLVIVAHGGTQMAVLEKWGRPVRDYYAWQTPCGCGWLLEFGEEREPLKVVKEVSFLNEP